MLDSELMSVVQWVATLLEQRLILSPTSISFWYKKSGRDSALAMIVSCRALLCRTEDPCALA